VKDQIVLREIEKGTITATLSGHVPFVLQFSSDGKFLISEGNFAVKVWSVRLQVEAEEIKYVQLACVLDKGKSLILVLLAAQNSQAFAGR
jgi:hypothetical protein